MKGLLLLSFLFLINALSAQEIRGFITDPEGVPLKGATISLLKAKDSSIQKLAISDASGHYYFLISQSGRYLLMGSYVGYNKTYQPVSNFTEEVKIICTRTTSEDLDKITVSTRKPMIEVKADKIVLNVEGSINGTGSDALELLRKAPGVSMDNDDNVSVNGKNGVRIFIDGKASPLSGTDLSNYLKSLPSSAIEAIEIITNPSARYEAAGNAGIINIRLKKNQSFGTNGTANAGYGYGAYSKYNGGLSLNYRNRKINLFSSYNYGNGKSLITTETYRIQSDTLFDQTFIRVLDDESHALKFGADYFIDKYNTVGVMVTANPGTTLMDQKSSTPIFYQPSNTKVKTLEASNTADIRRAIGNYNLNYHFVKGDREMNVDGDYGHYNIRNNQFQPNSYYSPSGSLLYAVTYNMESPTTIKLSSLKFNYADKLGKGKVDAGAKTSLVNSDNNFERFNVMGGVNYRDSSRSNHFIYKENINALYANYNREFENFSLQAGLRMENTNVQGSSAGYKYVSHYVGYDSLFRRSYFDLFPSFAITYKKNPDHQFILNYSRRIDRPAYQDLNPFEYKIDEYTYRKGNTGLRPQYSNSYGLIYVFKNKLTANLNFSHVQSVFTQIFDTIENVKTFITKSNLANQDIASLTASYALQYKRYSGFVNVNGFYSHYKANFGVGRLIDLDIFSFNFRMQHSIKIGKTYTAEMVLFYTSPSLWQGTFKSRNLSSLDLGIQKTFFENKLSAKLNVTDAFLSLKFRGTSNFAGQYMRIQRTWEPHLFRINLTYRFGNNQVKGARQRKTGLEEENSRVQSGSGS
jgi:iron complex outermembrane receptor protein